MKVQVIRETLVRLRYTLTRGYGWCSTPMMVFVGAGVLAPYIKKVIPSLSMWQIGLITLSIIFCVGLIDKYGRLMATEQEYITRNNPVMMQGLKGELKK